MSFFEIDGLGNICVLDYLRGDLGVRLVSILDVFDDSVYFDFTDLVNDLSIDLLKELLIDLLSPLIFFFVSITIDCSNDFSIDFSVSLSNSNSILVKEETISCRKQLISLANGDSSTCFSNLFPLVILIF